MLSVLDDHQNVLQSVNALEARASVLYLPALVRSFGLILVKLFGGPRHESFVDKAHETLKHTPHRTATQKSKCIQVSKQ